MLCVLSSLRNMFCRQVDELATGNRSDESAGAEQCCVSRGMELGPWPRRGIWNPEATFLGQHGHFSGPETGKRKRVTQKADGKLTES